MKRKRDIIVIYSFCRVFDIIYNEKKNKKQQSNDKNKNTTTTSNGKYTS